MRREKKWGKKMGQKNGASSNIATFSPLFNSIARVECRLDYQSFPVAVQDEMGYALGLAQLGAKHPKAKPWKGEGPCVFEIVEDHRSDTYRAIYIVRFAGVVYVLHAFQKKSKSGIKAPQEDGELIAERLKRAKADYESRGTP
jgi:phage-related protein